MLLQDLNGLLKLVASCGCADDVAVMQKMMQGWTRVTGSQYGIDAPRNAADPAFWRGVEREVVPLLHQAWTEREARADPVQRATSRARLLKNGVCSNPACDNWTGPSEAALPRRRCNGCGFVSYCGAKCQRGSWREHKAVCTAVQRDAA